MRSEMQRRACASQFRAAEESGKRHIEGYFAVFDDTYEMWDGASESIDKGAFEGQLDGDVRCLIDHESRLVLGRTTAGTLELRVDDHGLWFRVEINPDDTDAMNLYARVQRGDVNQCSFGFEILEERVSIDEETGHVHWTILRVKLHEGSIVTFPAYEGTSASSRKDEWKQIQMRRVDEWREKIKRRLRANGTQTGGAAP